MTHVPFAVVLGATLLPLFGCSSTPPPITQRNGTFFQFDDQLGAKDNAFERPYPPLDQPAGKGTPAYVGVSVLDGTVHLSRPANWKIRRASLTPLRRFIEYVSPDEYLFAVYEWQESSGDSWDEILGNYEKAAKAKGAEIVGQRIPMATWNAQGREYIVRRTIKGQRAPYSQLSSESMLRGNDHVELVEIVHQGESIAPIGGELLRVMETLEVK